MGYSQGRCDHFQKRLDGCRQRFFYAEGDVRVVVLQDQNRSMNPRVVFFVGDAARIHSPIGGQGMNLGIRDAIWLASVFAKHMQPFPQDPSSADKLCLSAPCTCGQHHPADEAVDAFCCSIGDDGHRVGKYLVWLVKIVKAAVCDWSDGVVNEWAGPSLIHLMVDQGSSAFEDQEGPGDM
ncbi:hypothetical protein F5887DRAFT_1004913, partial [Amanita rubescens]